MSVELAPVPSAAPRGSRTTTPLATALTAVSLVLLLGACNSDESVGQPVVEDPEIEAIPADVDPIDAGQVEADANEMVPAPTAEGATEELAVDLEETTTDAAEVADGAIDEATAVAEDGWSSLQANWAESVGDVRARFGELSEEEILATDGDRDRLVAVVTERYGITPEDAERQVADWEATL